MIIKTLLKYLFTWWNGNTAGTKLYTFLNGKKVGEDYLGNFYFESKDQKNRWCIYSNQSEASRISPEWNSWLRFISKSVPTTSSDTRYGWQKRFEGNASGLDSAYKPSTISKGRPQEDLEDYQSDYKAWKPE